MSVHAHSPQSNHHAGLVRLPQLPAKPAAAREALLIDAGLSDRHLLAAGAPHGITVDQFGGDGDGLAQLRDWAVGAGASDYAALHLLCHGAPGRLLLGTRTLDLAALAQPAVRHALRVIGGAVGPGGGVLLYSCEVAKGAAGRAFVAALSRALGVPVAAATGLIGAAALGGSWTLAHGAAGIGVPTLRWPDYPHTLTIASNVTTFSNIGANTNYQQLAVNYSTPAVLSQSDMAGSGWDVTAQSSLNTAAFALRGINGSGNGDGDVTSIRIQANDIDYVSFRSNGNGFYFDLTSFAIRNIANASFTVQALDINGNTSGAAVAFNISASPNAGGAFTTISLAGNSDFVGIFGFKVTLSTGSDAPFFDNLTVANIGIPALPTTTVSSAALSADTNIAGDFVTATAAQTISGSLSAALVAGESVQVSYDNGNSWSNASSFSTGSSSWSTSTTLAGSNTLQVRVTNTYGSSTAYSHSYTLDQVAPATPVTPDLKPASDSGPSSTDNITNVTTPEFSGTAESGSTVTLYDSDGSTVLGSAVATGGNWSITASTLTQGTHNLSVKASDLAGNVSAASSTLAVTIDTTAPSALALSSASASTSAASAGATVATLSATDSSALTYALASGNGSNDADNASFTISGNSLHVGASTLSAGTYHLYLSATDAAGNVSYLAQNFTVNAVPSVSTITRAGGATAALAGSASTASYLVTFSESVTGVDTSDFTLTGTGTASGSIASISGSGSSYTVTVNNLSGDGSLRLDLNSSGTGIQSGASVAIGGGYTAGASYTLDHTAPATPSAAVLSAGSDSGVSGSDNLTNVTTPQLSGTAESGSTVTLYDSDGTTVLGSTTASGGNWSITASTLSQGAHQLTVKATDAAGNVSAASPALSITVDTAAPSALALSDTNAAVVSATAGATLATLSASDSSAITYALATGNGSNDADNASFSVSGSSLQVGAAQLSAGTYHIYLSATDAAGNVSYLAQSISVQNAPAVSSIVRAAAAPADLAASANSASYTITFSESVTGVDASDFSLTSSGTASGSIASVSGSGSVYTVTVNSLSGDGALRLDLNSSATGIQNAGSVAIAAGYSSGASYTLDHSAPAAPTAVSLSAASDSGGSNSDAITSVNTPEITGSAEAYATVRLYDSDGVTLLGSTSADSAGHWSITSNILSDGSHTLILRQTDAAGNLSSASGGLVVVIDTAAAAPATPALASASDSGTTGDGITNVAAPTITGSAEANAAITLYDTDGVTVLGSANANSNGVWSIVSSTLSDGSHTLTAVQTDRAGNVSAASAGLTLQIDTSAPAAPGLPQLASASDTGTAGDNITTINNPVLTGSADANARVTLYDSNGSTVLGTATADGSGNWQITSNALATGVHTLTVKQSDAAGNLSPAGAALTLTIQAQQPSAPTPTTVDGVVVTQQSVTLPGGGNGSKTVVPIITSDRAESSGNSSVADIPLVTGSGANLLLAQLTTGFGLSASGGVSAPAGDPLQQLIKAIVAATPDHSSGDQGHLTGNGLTFLSQLAASVPLLVETITPVSINSGTLTLTGTSSTGQHTALVIDSSGLAAGATLQLNAVDFAAIIGATTVSGGTSGQILTGDQAAQQFIVGASSGGSVFAGGGSDTLVFNSFPGAQSGAARLAVAAADTADTAASTITVLHGGIGADSASFNGNADSYTIAYHQSYVTVTANAQPLQSALLINVETLRFADTTVSVDSSDNLARIAGLYQDTLGRQADYEGINFWASAAESGVSLGHIALAIISSSESQSKHAMLFNGDATHDLELLYQGIFGRASDATGLAFWVAARNEGVTLEHIADEFMHSVEAEAHKIGVSAQDFLISYG
ncbi:DUF4347 domain-containing protein [Duganella sp. FT80W]|uniref:DUF4347 domain-containing protein n=1 Tax=Duganella guangzhouensis TaxID=2666084 RepID=A0A6I2L8C3_9BURK|nr:Ig-like domain-containing protein [Duganella guangzhouensis]MRW94010.1 DUF4347 domain-containing protein [Duganella guangzhouensis]